MSTLTARRVELGSGGVTQLSVINAEWIKLRSLRSTWYSLLATVVIIVGLGTLFSSLRAHRFGQEDRFGFDPTLVSLRGVFLAQLAIGVLGVLVITGEYSTGMIRSSLAAVPHRTAVLIAKALVFAVIAFIVTQTAAFAAFLLGQQALASTHRQASLSTPGAERAILGAGLYLTLIGLFAVGLGFLIRSTAGADRHAVRHPARPAAADQRATQPLLHRHRKIPTVERRHPNHVGHTPRPHPARPVGRPRRHRPLRTRRVDRWRPSAETPRRLATRPRPFSPHAGRWARPG